MNLEWNEVKSIFKRKTRVCYIVLPRQTGKTTFLTEALLSDIDNSFYICPTYNMIEHVLWAMEKKGNRRPVGRIKTANSFIEKTRGIPFKKLLIDEFSFIERDHFLNILKESVMKGVEDILCVATMKNLMKMKRFKELYCPMSSSIEYYLLTVKDFEIKIDASEMMDRFYWSYLPKTEDFITERITGGLVC